MRPLFVLAGLAGVLGCATATPPQEGTDAAVGTRDGPRIDAPIGPIIDAPAPCTPVTANLLTNPAFEMITTGWMETRIGTETIIRNDGTVAAHTPTYKAWMGGVVGPFGGADVSDAIWQDVLIPPSTTQLVMTGFYDVRTSETGASVFDTGTVALVSPTNNAVIEAVLSVDNTTAKTAWTALDKTFAVAAIAGQTVRLRLTTSNDYSNATSFYFDSLALTATSCP